MASARAARVADDIGPVDLMCRDCDDGWIAVEIKRIGTIDAVEQLSRYLERIRLDPALADCRGVLAAQLVKPQARVLAEARGLDVGRGRPGRAARRARARRLRCSANESYPVRPEPRSTRSVTT